MSLFKVLDLFAVAGKYNEAKALYDAQYEKYKDYPPAVILLNGAMAYANNQNYKVDIFEYYQCKGELSYAYWCIGERTKAIELLSECVEFVEFQIVPLLMEALVLKVRGNDVGIELVRSIVKEYTAVADEETIKHVKRVFEQDTYNRAFVNHFISTFWKMKIFRNPDEFDDYDRLKDRGLKLIDEYEGKLNQANKTMMVIRYHLKLKHTMNIIQDDWLDA